MGTSKAESNKYQVPAIERGMAVLEMLASATEPLSLTDIAKGLNVTSGTLFRVLTTFEALGYVNKDENSGNYSLSLKLYKLAHTHPPVVNLLDAATRPMEALTHQVNESCHLSVLRYGKIVVLKETLNPPGQIRLSVSVGSEHPAVKTSSGRLLLAFLEDDILEITLERSAEYQSMSKKERKALHTKLADIRETGISTSENENHIGIRDAAVLVGNPQVGLTAALAITWLTVVSEPNHKQDIIHALKKYANIITNTMGLTE